MDPFYELLENMLQHDRRCLTCNEIAWIGYSDCGHAWTYCLNCGISWPDVNTGECCLNLAGYYGRYPTPNEPIPIHIENMDFERTYKNPDDFHTDKYYRLKN